MFSPPSMSVLIGWEWLWEKLGGGLLQTGEFQFEWFLRGSDSFGHEEVYVFLKVLYCQNSIKAHGVGIVTNIFGWLRNRVTRHGVDKRIIILNSKCWRRTICLRTASRGLASLEGICQTQGAALSNLVEIPKWRYIMHQSWWLSR